MDEFVPAKDRAFLEDWVSWWHDRHGFIFCAFAVQDAPQMNQAEVIHAGWVHRDCPNLSLLKACQADARDSLLLDVELKNYQSGSAPGGCINHSSRQDLPYFGKEALLILFSDTPLCQRSGIKRPLCVDVYSKLGISITRIFNKVVL